MLWVLLLKDVKRAWRNPWIYLIFMAIPVAVTGLVGLAFGGRSNDEPPLAHIKIAVVDRDNSILGSMIRSSLSQGNAEKFIDPQFVTASEGERLIRENQVSAVLVIPEDFTDDFLSGRATAPLELIKNPAQSIYPAITEELLRVVTAALNGITRNFKEELPEVRSLFESGGRPDMVALSHMVLRIGDKFDQADGLLFPPLIGYNREKREGAESKGEAFNLFSYLLPMMSSMFLLFLADGAGRDLYKEMRGRTLNRYRTLNARLLAFVLSKAVFAAFMVVAGGVIMFGLGGILFGITWTHPLGVGALTLAFAVAAAGLVMFLIALARSERRSDVLNGTLILGIAFIGGSAFQVQGLPPILRNYISPWMPNYWYIQAFQKLESGFGQWNLLPACLTLTAFGLIALLLATRILHQFLKRQPNP